LRAASPERAACEWKGLRGTYRGEQDYGQTHREAERKHLTNVLKMVAYHAESDLVKIVSRHYRRAGQEGRTLIQTALATAAELEVTKDAK